MDLLPEEKILLSINEAAVYAGIGDHRLRDIISGNQDYDFILRSGKHVLIKRKLFELWLMKIKYI